ncbi:hypothetical protein AQUCO_01100530v1 [Aquilegia coerulea]|uniref:Uncharacterized protein n=1 Tax=Aquilegia coerulea TaxID=218851 RepID=A0A2G5E7J2_AQUCA|nr:hypothetical protein AQUCO_01100530v1 [Aquilegia coerulea]
MLSWLLMAKWNFKWKLCFKWRSLMFVRLFSYQGYFACGSMIDPICLPLFALVLAINLFLSDINLVVSASR